MIVSLITSAYFLPNNRGLLYLAPTLSFTTMVLTSEKIIVFNIIITNDDKDGANTRFVKWQKMPTISYRYPSLISTISKIEEDEIN
jgi:hypothetical protein